MRASPCFLILALAGSCFAFSNTGSGSFYEGIKYLKGGKPTPEETAAIDAMSEPDRYNKAIELLLDAEKNTASPQETAAVANWLGHAYKELASTQGNDKDWGAAIGNMAEALKRQPEKGMYWHWQGHFQMESGAYWEAAQSLEKSRDLATKPEDKLDATTLLIKAYMKQAQSNDPKAVDYAIKEINTALGDHPEDWFLYYNLGDAYRLKGEGEQALKAWESGKKCANWPEWADTAFEKLKSAQTIKSGASFVSEKSLHFEIQFDGASQTSNARKFLDMFEAAYEELGAKFNIRPDHKIHVTVYVGEQFSNAVKIPWAAGVAQENRVDLMVNPSWPDEEYRDTVFHEYTHHLVHLKSGQKGVPSWLNEGLAMHQEPQQNTKRFYDLLHAIVRKQKKVMPLEKLAHGFTKLPSTKHVDLAYAESHSIVSMMIDRFRIDAILKILEGVAGGQDFEGEFQRVTRVSFKDFEREWLDQLIQTVDRPAAADPSFDGLNGKPRPVPGQLGAGH